MEISEEKLKELIINAIRRVQLENSPQYGNIRSEKVYVILTGVLNNKVEEVFHSLKKQSKYEVYAILPDGQDSHRISSKICKMNLCEGVMIGTPEDLCDTKVAAIIFPVVSRDLIIKTALGFSDTYETRWIRLAMEKGHKILFLRNGLEKFTGKEPKAYVKRILEYIRIDLEYGIQISNELSESAFLPTVDNFIETGKRKVITASDLEGYRKAGRIYLGSEDVITVMAKERAADLGIQIIKT